MTERSSGKSTLLNAFAGARLMPTAAAPETRRRATLLHTPAADEPRIADSSSGKTALP